VISKTPSAPLWLPASADLQLQDDEVHVWRAWLDLPTARLEQLHRILSEDEKAKAARFYFSKDRDHYTAARGFLRTLLGRYLAVEPAQIQFSYNQYGKPDLAPGARQTPVRFNLAHSHGLALFAFNRSREIGIDLEWMRPDRATGEIADRFFAPAEAAALRALPAELRPRAFFNCWTCKEAFIKARGLGLFLALDQFVVTLAPDETPALVRAEGDPNASSRWSLSGLDAAEGYAAAMAVDGQGWVLKCWDLR
jgi:4'-phosphopantetheinyl transferase